MSSIAYLQNVKTLQKVKNVEDLDLNFDVVYSIFSGRRFKIRDKEINCYYRYDEILDKLNNVLRLSCSSSLVIKIKVIKKIIALNVNHPGSWEEIAKNVKSGCFQKFCAGFLYCAVKIHQFFGNLFSIRNEKIRTLQQVLNGFILKEQSSVFQFFVNQISLLRRQRKEWKNIRSLFLDTDLTPLFDQILDELFGKKNFDPLSEIRKQMFRIELDIQKLEQEIKRYGYLSLRNFLKEMAKIGIVASLKNNQKIFEEVLYDNILDRLEMANNKNLK